MASPDGDTIRILNLVGQSNEDRDLITASYIKDDGDEVPVGYLNLMSYKSQPFDVVIVPVDGEFNHTADGLQTYLNKVYAPTFISWAVQTAAALVVDYDEGEANGLNTSRTLVSKFNSEMKAVIAAMEKRGDYSPDKATYYLFVMNKAENESLNGLMPFNSNYGFLFTGDGPDQTQLFHTVAHELGHGAFKLRHNFDQFSGIEKRSTKNLMDYTNTPDSATVLRKFQWDEIISPRLIALGWSEEKYSEESNNVFFSPIANRIDFPKFIQDEMNKEKIDSKFKDFLISYQNEKNAVKIYYDKTWNSDFQLFGGIIIEEGDVFEEENVQNLNREIFYITNKKFSYLTLTVNDKLQGLINIFSKPRVEIIIENYTDIKFNIYHIYDKYYNKAQKFILGEGLIDNCPNPLPSKIYLEIRNAKAEKIFDKKFDYKEDLTSEKTVNKLLSLKSGFFNWDLKNSEGNMITSKDYPITIKVGFGETNDKFKYSARVKIDGGDFNKWQDFRFNEYNSGFTLASYSEKENIYKANLGQTTGSDGIDPLDYLNKNILSHGSFYGQDLGPINIRFQYLLSLFEYTHPNKYNMSNTGVLFRMKTFTTEVSCHSLGFAIDVKPAKSSSDNESYNPVIGDYNKVDRHYLYLLVQIFSGTNILNFPTEHFRNMEKDFKDIHKVYLNNLKKIFPSTERTEKIKELMVPALNKLFTYRENTDNYWFTKDHYTQIYNNLLDILESFKSLSGHLDQNKYSALQERVLNEKEKVKQFSEIRNDMKSVFFFNFTKEADLKNLNEYIELLLKVINELSVISESNLKSVEEFIGNYNLVNDQLLLLNNKTSGFSKITDFITDFEISLSLMSLDYQSFGNKLSELTSVISRDEIVGLLILDWGFLNLNENFLEEFSNFQVDNLYIGSGAEQVSVAPFQPFYWGGYFRGEKYFDIHHFEVRLRTDRYNQIELNELLDQFKTSDLIDFINLETGKNYQLKTGTYNGKTYNYYD